jgi:hypothetical protein
LVATRSAEALRPCFAVAQRPNPQPKPELVPAETRTRVPLAFEVVRVSPPIIGRLRLGCLRRSPPAVFRFRCGSRVFRPTHAGSFPSQHPPPRLHFAFGAPDVERSHPQPVIRADADHRASHGPVSLGLDPSGSPPPAHPRRSTPGTLRAVTTRVRERVERPSGRGSNATTILFRPRGFAPPRRFCSAPRGPGLLHPGTGHGVRCVSRPPGDEHRSARGGRQGDPVPEGEGDDPDPRSADPSKV